MGGAISVDDAPEGAVLSTMGGPIRVRSAARFVKAKTMGGEVRLDAVDGWIDATTMGGGRGSQDDRGSLLREEVRRALVDGGGRHAVRPRRALYGYRHRAHVHRGARGGIHDHERFPDQPGSLAGVGKGQRLRAQGHPRERDRVGGNNRITLKTINGNVVLKKL